MEYTHIKHSLKPIYNEESKVLILGTLPSPLSRKNNYYYGNPRNRFWSVLEKVFDEKIPNDNDGKTEFLLKHNIAIWDTVFECDIMGASDSSIKNVVPTNIKKIVDESNIKMIFTTGSTAYKYYCKYHEEKVGIKAISLKSTSPANARYSVEDLSKEYEIIKKYL